MSRPFRFLAAALTAGAILAGSVPAVAQPKDQDKDKQQMKSDKSEKKAKKRAHKSGKNMLGDKIRGKGEQKLEDRGKFSATADVENGKVRGVKVRHKDRGDVKVTKYKTDKDMSNASLMVEPGVYPAQTVVTLWIGYSYWDDYYGEEVIYWFPVDMVYDADYGAVWYYDDVYYEG